MMDKVEILLPVSRSDHLIRVFNALELLDCDHSRVNLLTYVDGDQQLYEEVCQRTEASKFEQRRCVQRPDIPVKAPSHVQLAHRARPRIAAIHNELKALVGDCTYIFGIEDDTLIPRHALKTLLHDYAIYPFAGLIEGVELGRWGWAPVGAWRADNVYEPSSFESLAPGQGIEEIDGGGFYCFLTKRDNYVKHEFKPYPEDLFGPDVEYGISLRREGFKNYIDWSISCGHLTPYGREFRLSNTTPSRVRLEKRTRKGRDEWRQLVTSLEGLPL